LTFTALTWVRERGDDGEPSGSRASSVGRYALAAGGLAIALVAVATALTALAWPRGLHAPFTLYYVAVTIATAVRGPGAGGLAIVLSAAVVDGAFVGRVAAVTSAERLVGTALFTGVAGVMIAVVYRMRRGEQHLRRQAREIERLGRLNTARSQINHTIVVERDRDALLARVCAVLVDHGGFRMAWVGWHDPALHRLVPVAQAGDDGGYLDGLVVTTDDRAEGRGPTGTAFRDGRPYVCNDLLHDPATVPWRDACRRLGFRASAALPVRVNGDPAATLNVYSDRAGFFRDAEVELLAEVAADLSFSLDNLARQGDRERAEAQVERERRFSDELIEALPGIFYLYDEQGRFLRWNRNFEEVSGCSRAEIAAHHPLDFFAGDDRARVAERIAQVFARGEATVEAGFVTRDGSAVPYFLTGRRILDGTVPRLIGVGVDIAERKRAEQALARSEERYRTTLESMLEGCQILGFDWTYLYLNGAAAQHNRRPNHELLGRRMPDVWPGIEDAPVFAMLRQCLDARIAVHGETEFAFADGERAWFDIRAQPVPEGIFVLSIDISERKAAEATLRGINEHLEHMVAERTSELDAARIRAEAADRLKSAFLATMSHELRTPLNSIIGFTGIVLQGLAGPLSGEQHKQLGMVQGSARHLLELINDVLDISKIEAGQLAVHPAGFDLTAAIEGAVATVRPLADRKGLAVEVAAPAGLPPMVSDRRRVAQILINLLNNAIKFTDRGRVTLDAEAVVEGGRPVVRIRVADTGIGMKREDLQSLFQPFRQIDTGLQRQHEGTGLGLAISRRLAELLGGGITVDSTWGRGSVFTVTLPQVLGEGAPS
jgi:PAS domain S-box-containing protein